MKRTLTTALLAATAISCGDVDLETRKYEIRPTEDNAYLGIGYGDAVADSYASPGGDFRVHWATEGVHAPPMEDTSPANGVPDFVDEVAATADAVNEKLRADGWRVALSDENQSLPNGGDGRFDIYLVDFGGSSDGLVVANGCTTATPSTCTAHMLMENDFSRSGYSSVSEAITVLVSHEYFHAVQNAYIDDLPPWWSEGTATWFEEHFDPSQQDFERLANTYFAESSRSIDSRSQGPFDSFSYGIGLFAHFIDLQFGVEVLRGSFDRIGEGEEPLDAIDGALVEAGSSLGEAFETFAVWNAFTGGRSVGEGYPSAALYDQVEMQELDGSAGANWNVAVDGLAAKYAKFTLSGGAAIKVVAADGSEAPSVFVATGPGQYEPADGYYATDTSLIFVVANPAPGTERTARIEIRNQAPPEETNNGTEMNNVSEPTNNEAGPDTGADGDPSEGEEGGCSTAGGPSDAGLFPLFAMLAWLRRRSRRG